MTHGGPDEPIVEHATRTNLFHRPATFRLFDDRLERQSVVRVRTVACRDVRSIHAIEIITASGETLRRCRMRAADGRLWQIQSAFFRRWSTFEDRSATYDRLLHDLVGRVAASNPQATFWVGQPLSTWAGSIFTLVLLLGLAVISVPIAFSDIWSGLFLLVSCLSALPLCWKIASKGRARSVDPQRLLAEHCR